MRKITLICVGDLKEKYLQLAVEEYRRRLSRFFDFNIIQIPESKIQKNTPSEIAIALTSEADKILPHTSAKTIFPLAIEGELLSSEQFAHIIQSQGDYNHLCFIIGSSHGLDAKIKNLGKKISFGKITLPHQLMRVVFIEQLYRAGTIINNIEYHK